MKITAIRAYRIELPLHEGSYKWSGGNAVAVFDSTVVEACLPDLNAWGENVRPGTVLNAGATITRLADLPDDGWRHMRCVEAARTDEQVMLAPGGSWQGWQQLTVL